MAATMARVHSGETQTKDDQPSQAREGLDDTSHHTTVLVLYGSIRLIRKTHCQNTVSIT